ncbi:MAG: zinc-ribbon domain containing protein [Chloroflexaceae bacterium]
MPFYRDMELICRSCGEKFIFTAGEQEFYADKGFLHEPTRCPRCRTRRDGPAGRRQSGGPARGTPRDKQA